MIVTINIAQEYTKTPGGRFSKEGKFSGEDFRKKILLPRYKEAVSQNKTLCIILDGGYGYGSSFLEESFGGLVREEGPIDINFFEFVSDEEPQLILDIRKYITDANEVYRGKRNEN